MATAIQETPTDLSLQQFLMALLLKFIRSATNHQPKKFIQMNLRMATIISASSTFTTNEKVKFHNITVSISTPEVEIITQVILKEFPNITRLLIYRPLSLAGLMSFKTMMQAAILVSQFSVGPAIDLFQNILETSIGKTKQTLSLLLPLGNRSCAQFIKESFHVINLWIHCIFRAEILTWNFVRVPRSLKTSLRWTDWVEDTQEIRIRISDLMSKIRVSIGKRDCRLSKILSIVQLATALINSRWLLIFLNK